MEKKLKMGCPDSFVPRGQPGIIILKGQAKCRQHPRFCHVQLGLLVHPHRERERRRGAGTGEIQALTPLSSRSW